MKSAFASCLIASMAVAQSYDYPVDPVAYPEEPEFSVQDLFELNEDGRYQLIKPDLPQISFADSSADVEGWALDKEAAYKEMDQKWMDAWGTYQQAIAQPWNDFLTTSEELEREGSQLDVQTTEEVVNFVADNTYVDGQTLNEAFPEVQEWLAGMRDEVTRRSEEFSLDKLRVPMAMRRERGTQDDEVVFKAAPISLQYDGYYYDGQSSYDYQYYEESGPSAVQQAMEEFAGKVQDALITYGYDPEVVNTWFQTAGQNWEDLKREQQVAETKLAQQQIHEASDYVKAIVDNAMADLRPKAEQAKVDYLADLDAKVAEYKDMVDRETEANLNQLEQWINDTHAQVEEMATADMSQQFNSTSTDSIAFSSKFAAAEDSSSNAGYGLLAFGAIVATGAYLYQQKKQQKESTTKGESLLSEDTEFVLV